MAYRSTVNKSVDELEEERLQRFVAKPPNQRTTTAPKVGGSQQQQQPKQEAPQKEWAYKNKQQETKVALVGSSDMDLSTRINYLNSLYDQGAIDDGEYAKRSAALQIVAQMVEACISGNANELEKLVRDNPGIDLNMIKENQSTILHLAGETVLTGRGEPKMLEVLLQHGADVNALRKGQTLLHSVCERANSHIAEDCIRILIKYRADVNAAPVQREGENSSGIRALGNAIENGGSSSIVNMLLEAGASPNGETTDGPVLNFCIINDRHEDAKTLLRYGADPNSRERQQGATALATAISNANAELVTLLIQKGANRTAFIMNGQNATPKQLLESIKSQEPSFVAQVEKYF